MTSAWCHQHCYMTWTGVILIASSLASSLLLSSNNRVSSFYWTRGSKLCFLTQLLLSYSRIFSKLLLTSFSAPFLAAQESDFLSCFLIPSHSEVLSRSCAPILLAHITHFLKARHSKWPGSRLTTSFLSHCCLLPKVSHTSLLWAIVNHSFSSHTISLSLHFLGWHKPLLHQCSTAWSRNPQGIFKLVNQGWLLLFLWQHLDDFPSALCT